MEARAFAARSAFLVLAIFAAALSPLRPAHAQCVQSGSTVTCTGTDLDGFPNPVDRPPATDDLLITVEPGAFVVNQGSGSTIELLQNNTVRIEPGSAVAASGGNAVILGTVPGSPTRRNVVEHHGLLDSRGDGARGIALPGEEGRIESSGSLFVSGANAVGFEAAEIDRTAGRISVRGGGAVGIRADTVHSIGDGNSGLFVIGDDAIAIDASTSVERNGNAIGVIGQNAIGIRAPSVGNRGPLDIRGDGAIGILVTSSVGQGPSGQGNQAHVLVSGRGGVAAWVTGDQTFFNSDSIFDRRFRGILDASDSEDGIGLLLEGANASVRNFGSIRGGTGDGAGVVLGDTPGSREVELLGGGRISSENGIAIRGGRGSDTVSNLNGTIVGLVELGAGDDTFTTQARFFGTPAPSDGGPGRDLRMLTGSSPGGRYDLGSAVAFERLEISGPWTLRGTGSYPEGIFVLQDQTRIDRNAGVQDRIFVRGGSVRLDDGISLPAGVDVESGFAIFGFGAETRMSTSRLRVSGDGVLIVNESNAMQGDLELSSVLDARLESDGSLGHLDLDGDLTLGPSSQLRLVRTDQRPFEFLGRSTFRVLTSTGSFDGRFRDVDLLQWRFGCRPSTNPVCLTEIPMIGVSASYGSAAGLSFLDVTLTNSIGALGGTGNGVAVGLHLDEAVAQGGSPGIEAILYSLRSLSNAEAAGALDMLHGEVYDAHTSTALATGARYAEMLIGRPAPCELERRAESERPCDVRELRFWTKGIGLFGDRDSRSDHKDWSSSGGGIVFGLDKGLGNGVTASAVLGTSRSAVDFDGEGDGSYTTFEAGLGLAWRSGGTRVRAAVGYGHGWHDTRRQVQYPDVSELAFGDYESNRITGRLEVAQLFEIDVFDIEPFVSLDYTWLDEEDVDESNARSVRLEIDSRTNSLIATEAGVRARAVIEKESEFLPWANGLWRPQIHGAWRQIWNDYDRALSSRLRAAPPGTPKFRTRSQDAQYGARAGAGVLFQPASLESSFELGYDIFVGDRSTVHQVLARVRVPL